MYIFKASGETFDSVVKNQRHAFANMPKDWYKGEVVLVSKNRKDCKPGEKQIQYVMKLEDIRGTSEQEIEKYWPGNGNRWRYIVICSNRKYLKKPFNLENVLDEEKVRRYNHAVTFTKLDPLDEKLILQYIKDTNGIILS